MSGIYSETFVVCYGVNASVRYWVPPGMRAIVKTVLVSTSIQAGELRFQAIAGNSLLATGLIPANSDSKAYAMHVAVYGGQPIEAWTESGGLYVTIAGYLFEDVAGATGPPAGAAQLPEPRPLPWID